MRKNLAEILPLDFPLSIDFELTNKCNFKCTFCPESFKEYEELGFSFSQLNVLEKIINEVKSSGRKLKKFRFSMMGESLLHPEFDKFLKLAVDSSFTEHIEITTNGSVLSEKKIKTLLKSPPDLLRISIYGLSEDEYKLTTQKTNMFHKVQKNIKLLRKLRGENNKPLIYIKFFSSDKKNTETFFQIYSSLADKIESEGMHSWTGSDEFEFPLTFTKSNKNDKMICPFPFYKVVIHSNGEFTFCCVDWKRETSVGNIKEKSISELFNGSNARNFRRNIIKGKDLPKPCIGCDFYKLDEYSLDNIDKYKF